MDRIRCIDDHEDVLNVLKENAKDKVMVAGAVGFSREGKMKTRKIRLIELYFLDVYQFFLENQ